ncbi:MAG: helix-turn-helix domain-containing protein [Rhodanobacteraceae bacterium]|nr:helix-turn-helix domain-containing protein [Rhodanobacteraceae bacterium]
MSYRRMPMRQLMNLARLRFAEQRSYSEIAASLGMARSTVQSAVERFVQAGFRSRTLCARIPCARSRRAVSAKTSVSGNMP